MALRIDVHSHFTPTPYVDRLQAGDGPTFAAGNGEDVLKLMIDQQDNVGVNLQVLSSGPFAPYLKDARLADDAARCGNDLYAEVIGRYGGRFSAFAHLPLPYGEAAAREAVRCLDELRFPGVYMGCSALGRPLDHPDFAELWSELDAREAIVFVHPGGIAVGTEPGLAGMDTLGLALGVGSASEIAMAALRLSTHVKKYPRVRVVIAIMGGALSYLVPRIDFETARVWMRLKPGEPAPSVVEDLRRLHYDVNFLPDPSVLAGAIRVFGSDRMVFGSDAPGLTPAMTLNFLDDGLISADDRDAIVNRNPVRLFEGRLPA